MLVQQIPLISRMNQPNVAPYEPEKQLILNIIVSQNDQIVAGERLKLSEVPVKLTEFHDLAAVAFQKSLSPQGLSYYRD